MSAEAHFYGDVLPAGIRSRLLPNGNGLLMHVLEAGYARAGAGPVSCCCTASRNSPIAGAS